ncbi:hypothetical protein [Campylobacter magnus]|uniref:hypothetical protein n=1 Tax=Campylobacter magnus TaxID=3026462 RepID=UPI002361CA11|nr:hypothetical protein [Campylobacter magnus]MDD0855354.1 hypothetical protein [Campylobacter magnus]
MKNHLLLANNALDANATVASPLNQNAQGLFGFNKMALFDYDLDDMIEYAALNSLFANAGAANAGFANPLFGNQLFANNGANIFSQISALYNADFSQLQTNSAQSPLNQNAQGLFGFNKMALFDYDLDDMIENAALSSLFANNANTQLFSTNALNNAFMMEAYEDFYDDMKDYYKIGLLNKQDAQGGMQGLFFIDD